MGNEAKEYSKASLAVENLAIALCIMLGSNACCFFNPNIYDSFSLFHRSNLSLLYCGGSAATLATTARPAKSGLEN